MTDQDQFEIHEREQSPAAAPPKRSALHLLWQIPLGLLALALAGAVLFFVFFRGTDLFDSLRRYVSYGTMDRGGSRLWVYEADAYNHFAMLGDSLLVLSPRQVSLSDAEGGELYRAEHNYRSPALTCGGDYAAAYDVGGDTISLFNRRGLIATLHDELDGPILAANLNRSGYLAVTVLSSGYKGSVLVFDPTQTRIFRFDSADHFLTDARVSEDHTTLIAAALGQEGGTFQTELICYDLKKTEPSATAAVPDGVPLQLAGIGNHTALLTDRSLTLFDKAGLNEGSFSFRGEYLRACDFGGSGFAVLLLGRYQSGSAARVVSIGPDGTLLGELEAEGDILSISACADHIAVLYGAKLCLFDKSFNPVAALNGTSSARSVLLRQDGTAVLTGRGSATIFMP